MATLACKTFLPDDSCGSRLVSCIPIIDEARRQNWSKMRTLWGPLTPTSRGRRSGVLPAQVFVKLEAKYRFSSLAQGLEYLKLLLPGFRLAIQAQSMRPIRDRLSRHHYC